MSLLALTLLLQGNQSKQAESGFFGNPVAVAITLVVVFIMLTIVIVSRIRKVGPNRALVVSGVRKVKIVTGGSVFVIPGLETVQEMSLELMTLPIKTPEVYTITGVPIIIEGVAQIKVGDQVESIRTAATQFMSKPQAEMARVTLQTVEGHLRAIVGTLTVEEIYKNREAFAQRVQEVAASDLSNMGLRIVSFQLQHITDEHGYLDALGKPRTAEVLRDAQIGEAMAMSQATQKKAQAEQAAREAEFAAQTKIAESRRDFETKQAEYIAQVEQKKAEYQVSVNRKKAEADLSYDIQKAQTAQLLKEQETKTAELESKRKEMELLAGTIKPAEAERKRIETMADAEKYRQTVEAEARAAAIQKIATGEAEATKARAAGDGEAVRVKAAGEAEAIKAKGMANAQIIQATGESEANAAKAKGLGEGQAIKAKGLAEAEVILAKGQNEATAMDKKAEAWKQYTEAAIAQMLIERLPEIVKGVSEPLSRIDKITIVNTGGTDGTGLSKITHDVTNVVAQIPPLVEALAGVDLHKLVQALPGLKKGDTKGPAQNPKS